MQTSARASAPWFIIVALTAACGEPSAPEEAASALVAGPACDLSPVLADTFVAVDVPVARLTVQLALDGAPLGDDGVLDGNEPGMLVLRRAGGDAGIPYDLPETGGAELSLLVHPGTYDIYLYTNRASAQDLFPGRQNVKLAGGVVVDADVTIALEAWTAHVTGRVTVGGRTLSPAEQERDLVLADPWPGNLNLPFEGPRDRRVRLDADGGYALWTFATTYAVGLLTDLEDSDDLPALLRAPLGSAVIAPGTSVRDFDLEFVDVSGEVQVDGGTMPDDLILDGSGRGMVTFHSQFGRVAVPLGESGPATYTARLPRGTYRLELEGNADDRQSVLPRSAIELAAAVEVTGPATRVDDVAIAALDLHLLVDGQEWPDAPDGNHRATVVIRRDGINRDFSAFTIADTGPARVRTPVYAGEYTLELQTTGAAFQVSVPPDQTVVMSRGTPVHGLAAVVHDLRTVRVSGEVSLEGAPLPEAAGAGMSGTVSFVSDAGTTWVEVDAAGPARYSAWLFAGTFEAMAWVTGDALPGGLGGALATLVAGEDLTHDFDLSVVELTGRVTVNGAPLASVSPATRVDVLRWHPSLSRVIDQVSAPVAADGTFRVRVSPGPVEILVRGDGVALPREQRTVLRACPQP